MNGLKTIASILLTVLLTLDSSYAAEPDLRSTFQKFVVAQNSHDLAGLKRILLDSPDFLWVAGGFAIWGREAALQHFAELYKGTWKLEPYMAAYRSQQLGANVVDIFVPIIVTVGATGKPASRLKILMNQIYLRVGNEWLLAKILPIPAAG